MKRAALFLGVVVVVIAAFIVVQRAWYQKNQAEPIAAEALQYYRDAGLPDAFAQGPWTDAWITEVRTEDGDGEAYFVKAWAPYRANLNLHQQQLGNLQELAESERPEDVAALEKLLVLPELAALEAAGRQKNCQIVAKVVKIADNPIESEIPPAIPTMKLADVMIIKARRLAADGDTAAAETELKLALSVGRHLEDEYSLFAYAGGIAIQKNALLALEELYTNTGRADEAAEAKAMADTWETRRGWVKGVTRLFEMSLSEEGIAELERMMANPDAPNAFKAEAVMGLAAGHLLSMNGIVYGPEDRRREAIERAIQSDDPVLAELASKSKGSILRLSVKERVGAMQMAHALED